MPYARYNLQNGRRGVCNPSYTMLMFATIVSEVPSFLFATTVKTTVPADIRGCRALLDVGGVPD